MTGPERTVPRPVAAGLWALCLTLCVAAAPLLAAEGHIVFRNDSAQPLSLRSKYGNWHRPPVKNIPAGTSSRVVVRFPEGGVVVQSLSYAFSTEEESHCQLRVGTVPGPTGCVIELMQFNRKQMNCFAHSTRRNRDTCAFEVEVEITPARP